MLTRLRQFRGVEFQLLFTVLVFFAAGYTLVMLATRQREFVATLPGLLTILWPSALPLLLFIAVSIGLGFKSPHADQVLLPLVALLAGLSLMLTARLEPSLNVRYLCTAVGGEVFPCYEGIASKQSLWVTLGVLGLAAMLFVPWDRILIRWLKLTLLDVLDNYRYLWLTIGLVLIFATFLFGVDPNDSGVKVWFNFGFFFFQPSELLKIILVIFLASYLNQHREVVAAGYRLGPLTLPPLPYLVPLLGMWGIAMGTIVFQRDLGAALLLYGVFLAMLYIATGRAWYVLAGMLAFGIGAYVLYQLLPIVSLRVQIWLDPWAQAQNRGYQIVQAIYAMASGGVFGQGLGMGVPAVVPAIHTDFIFTAIGEEMGLIGTLAVLIAYILLIFRGYHIALRIPGRFRGFEQLLAIGLTTIIAVQTLIIIGGNLRLIPLTGITLPFISYGGSSVLINFIIVGLLMRISATAHAQP
ncbi:FtsW/RodA/SpoVE family cell cycle protein [Candidatus Chloroploca sp. M-50]|uniref:FtsW/RodA/SpoVE family cell cycle protein n=1 Tax=Candidatus Chloroploca mongolica TaxID=2528176 RepID=A0ABS4DFD6_9CHLR|nr:FtsW/RodA/SpoVE family cell cycle protein [Candidatus Chloroploca mongolica]MBP1468159.1 FtsW/RodA/SpoVE family cell cycle protein [Candidatus Chloroploca mongolica]